MTDNALFFLLHSKDWFALTLAALSGCMRCRALFAPAAPALMAESAR